MNLYVVASLVLLAIIGQCSVHGATCYVDKCTEKDARCKSTVYDTTGITTANCTDGCVKIAKQVKFFGWGDLEYERKCADSDSKVKTCVFEEKNFIVTWREKPCPCTTDLCNGAQKNGLSIAVVSIVSVLAMVKAML